MYAPHEDGGRTRMRASRLLVEPGLALDDVTWAREQRALRANGFHLEQQRVEGKQQVQIWSPDGRWFWLVAKVDGSWRRV